MMSNTQPFEYREIGNIQLDEAHALWLRNRLSQQWVRLLDSDIATCRDVHQVVLLHASSRSRACLGDFALEVFRNGLAAATLKPPTLHTLTREEALSSFLQRGKDFRYRFKEVFDDSIFASRALMGTFPVGPTGFIQIDDQSFVVTWTDTSWTKGQARTHVMGKYFFECLRLVDWRSCPGGLIERRAFDLDDRLVESVVLDRYGHPLPSHVVDDSPLVLPDIPGFGDVTGPSSQPEVSLDW